MSAGLPAAARVAVYAGSFDPPTLGHLWMVEHAAPLFDQLVVAVGINPAKAATFAPEERVTMLRESLAHLPNVVVETVGPEFLAAWAVARGAGYLVRGVRGSADAEAERQMRHFNASLAPALDTVILMPPRELEGVSSSFVRGLVGPRGWRQVVAPLVPAAALEALSQRERRRRWESLAARVGLVFERAMGLWEELAAAWGEPGRHYHGWGHLDELLESLDRLPVPPRDPLALELALWWHDLILQDPPAGLGPEEASARRAAEALRGLPGTNADLGERVAALILATDHRRDPGEALDGDAALLHDLDLSILAAPRERYAAYAADVRREYARYPEAEFRAGRRQVLEGFLARAAIFHTEAFRAEAEGTARDNLAWEISGLVGP